MTYYINDAIQASSWFDAFSYCKSLGMDLYSPQTDETNQQIFEMLEDRTEGHEAGVSIGGSRIGTTCFWYSTKTGLEIDFKFRQKEFTRENVWNEYCLQFVKTSNKYQFEDVDCYLSSKHFLCEWKDS